MPIRVANELENDGYAELLEQLPLGVVEMTPLGEVTLVNENARLLLAGPPGVEVRELLTRLAKSAWASRGCVEHALALGRLGEVRLWAAPSRGKEGVTVVLERHATQRSRLESKLLSMLVKAATGIEGWHACATRALETLCVSMPGTHFVLYERGADGTLQPTAHAGLPLSLASGLRPLLSHASELVGRVLSAGQMMAVSPLSHSPLVMPFAYPPYPPLAAVAIPLNGSSGVRGVFYACGPESVLAEAEARLLLQLAEMLGLLLEQKGRDERVATERDRFATLLENLPDAVLELGPDGIVRLAGGGTSEVFGLPPEALEGLSWHAWVGDAERARLESAKTPIEVRVRGADGVERTCSVASHQASDDVKRVVFRDVSEQVRLRAEAHAAMDVAARNERLAILGRLTAGVGHELNNPLSYLTSNLGALREELEPLEGKIPKPTFDEMRSMVDDCEEGVKRLVSIVQALKGSSRQGNVETTTVFDPAHAVSNAVTLFRGVNRHKVAVEWDGRSLPLVSGSVSALAQVLLNLLQNGMDAMGGKGRLSLHGAAHADDATVVIEVTDEGPGIPAEVQPKVFEPFYTTKPEGNGTGLGLFLCLQMVQGMGGTLTFRTGEKGTTFSVRLPVAAEESDDLEPAKH